jgi:hypothetical protein
MEVLMQFTRFSSVSILMLAVAAVACGPAPADDEAMDAGAMEVGPAPGEPTLDEIRAATEKYRDIEVALAEGYMPDPSGMCATAEMEGRPASDGGMGVHYVRMDRLGIPGPPEGRVDGNGTHTNFMEPSVLLYEPQADGSWELVGVENLVFRAAWEAEGHEAPPTFHGVEWNHMADDPATEFDEAHMFMPHYDRHVWIYRDNPDGVFEPFNPNVTCEHFTGVPESHMPPPPPSAG